MSMEFNAYKTKYPKETGRFIVAYCTISREEMYNSFGTYQGDIEDWKEEIFNTEEQMLEYIIQLKASNKIKKIEAYKEMCDIKKYEF